MINVPETTGYSLDMISLAENKEWFIPRDGKYLIQTVSESKFHPNKTYNLFATNVTKTYDEKKGKWHMSFDCNNQVVTHISAQPFSYNETEKERTIKNNKLLGKYEDPI
jgi:hypothetical protein